MERGAQADPAVIQGGFSQPLPTDQVEVESGEIRFYWKSGDIRMLSYRLMPEAIQIEYHLSEGAPPAKYILPIALDPWLRFNPEFPRNYLNAVEGDIWRFWTDDGFGVAVRTSASMKSMVFTDSLEYVSVPEDPNRDYPGGHFLPFPMAILEVWNDHDLNPVVRIELQY